MPATKTSPTVQSSTRDLHPAADSSPVVKLSRRDLLPVLRSAHGTPARRVSAVLAAGWRFGLSPVSVRNFLAHSPDKEIAEIAANLPLLFKLSADALDYVRASDSSAGRAASRRDVAKRMVSRILTPAHQCGPTLGSLSQTGPTLGSLPQDQPNRHIRENGVSGLDPAQREMPKIEAEDYEGAEHSHADYGPAHQLADGQTTGRATAVDPAVGPGEPEPGGPGLRSLPRLGKSGLGDRRLVSARIACGVLGVTCLEGTAYGFEGARIPEADLGAGMGVTRLTARSALHASESLSWLACTQRRGAGFPSRYKFEPLPRGVEVAAMVHLGLIGLLGNLELLVAAEEADAAEDEATRAVMATMPSDARAARVMLSAGHAAWGYGKPDGATAGEGDTKTHTALPGLTHRDWLVLLATEVGVDPATLGLAARAVKTSLRDLAKAGIGPTKPGTLDQQLDQYAFRSGAKDRYTAAWAVRGAARVERTKSLDEVRTKRKTPKRQGPVQAKIFVDRIMVVPMPRADTLGKPPHSFVPWLKDARERVAVLRNGNDHQGPSWTGDETLLEAELTARATAKGYTDAVPLAQAVLRRAG